MMVLSLELHAKCGHHYAFDFSKNNGVLLHQEVNKWLISVNSERFPLQNFINGLLWVLMGRPRRDAKRQQAE